MTAGGQTTGALDYALSLLNRREPSEYAQSTGLMLETASDLQRFWEMRNELRFLVEEWQACGQSFDTMYLKDRERGVALQTGWVADLGPDGRFRIDRDGRSLDTSPRGVALTAFAKLMNDPDRQLLGGPCERCKQYYRKKRKNQKRFCGRRCAHLASATNANRERLDRERRDKLMRARKQLEKWQTMKRTPNVGWKHWIAGHEPDLTVSFLTRAVKREDLVPPKTEGGKNQIGRR